MKIKMLQVFKINKNSQRKIMAGMPSSSQASNTEAPITDPCVSLACIEEEEDRNSANS